MNLVMMGTGSFAQPTFEALLQGPHPVVGLVTQPDRPTGKEKTSTRQARRGMKEIAQDKNIPLYQPESINTAEGIDRLKAWKPDLLVVAAFGQILSRDVLAVTPHGGINIHASLLPKYRGAAPIAWAIYHGETETGVTVIKMSVHLDAGDIMAREALAIGPEETAGELEERLAPLGAKLARQVIDQIAAGTARGSPQDKSQASKAPKLTKEHGAIDWSRAAREIRNHIRAMQPWPTAYSFLHRRGSTPLRIIFFRACPFPPEKAAGLPEAEVGALAQREGQLLVRSGDGWLEVQELQPAGKRRMTATQFLHGYLFQPGDRFGPETP